jgi:glycosyltransferase
MRVGGTSNGSLANLLRKSCEDFAALRQNGINPVQALFLKNVSKLPQFVLRPRAGGARPAHPAPVRLP